MTIDTTPIIDLKRLVGRLNKLTFPVKVTVGVTESATFQHPKAGTLFCRTIRLASAKPSDVQAEIENEIRSDLAWLAKPEVTKVHGEVQEYVFYIATVFLNKGFVHPETQKLVDQPMITYTKRAIYA